MPLTPTEKLVWYLEVYPTRQCGPGRRAAGFGSAVAIRVDRDGHGDRSRKYLLTCAHVLRAADPRGQPSGRWLEHVACYRPGFGYSPLDPGAPWPIGEGDGIWSGRVIDPLGRDTNAMLGNVFGGSGDFALVDIEDESFQDFPVVESIAHAPDGSSAKLSVIGYPDASRTWTTGTPVRPLEARGFRVSRTHNDPAIAPLTGPEETAPGMSGGGVFGGGVSGGNVSGGNVSGGGVALVGIHRGQREQARRTETVRATHIRSEMASTPFRWNVPSHPIQTEPVRQDLGKDLVGFWTDFNDLSQNFVKAVTLAPLVDLVANVGPPGDHRVLWVMGIVATQFAMVSLVWAWGQRLKAATRRTMIGILAVGMLTAVISYIVIYRDRVRLVPRGEDEEVVVIGSEYQPKWPPELVAQISIDELLALGDDASDIWTARSINRSHLMLATTWFAAWMATSLLIALAAHGGGSPSAQRPPSPENE